MNALSRQLAVVRAERAQARPQRYRRSRLDRYRTDLEQLAAQGASWRDLAHWLRMFRRVVVHPTTIGRRMAEWARQAVPASTERGP